VPGSLSGRRLRARSSRTAKRFHRPRILLRVFCYRRAVRDHRVFELQGRATNTTRIVSERKPSKKIKCMKCQHGLRDPESGVLPSNRPRRPTSARARLRVAPIRPARARRKSRKSPRRPRTSPLPDRSTGSVSGGPKLPVGRRLSRSAVISGKRCRHGLPDRKNRGVTVGRSRRRLRPQ